MRSIFNFQFSIFNSQRGFTTFSSHERGFTLIELLVALVVIASFGTIVVAIITSAFRGTSKTDVINTVRQNGNYAISQMQKMIAYAKSFDGASIDGNDPWVCQVATQYKSVKITSSDGGTTIFSCEADKISSNSSSLTNTESVTVTSGSCFFTCSQLRITDSPTVGINFTLTSIITSGMAEKQASIPFNTSIKVRN